MLEVLQEVLERHATSFPCKHILHYFPVQVVCCLREHLNEHLNVSVDLLAPVQPWGCP